MLALRNCRIEYITIYERKPQTTFYRRERLFHLFPKLFTKKFQREIDINVEAVKDAQAIINAFLESSDLTEAETQEAQKIELSA